LKIEFHTTLREARPLSSPVSEEMAMRTLPRFVAVRTGNRFLLRSLGMGGKYKYTKIPTH